MNTLFDDVATADDINQEMLAAAYYGLYTLIRLALKIPSDKLKTQVSVHTYVI